MEQMLNTGSVRDSQETDTAKNESTQIELSPVCSTKMN